MRSPWFWLLIAALTSVAVFAYLRYFNVPATPAGDASGRVAGGADGSAAGGRKGSGGGSGAGAKQGGDGKGGSGAGNRPLPVIAEEAKSGTMDVFLSALGSVTAANSAIVRPRVDGQLMRIAFREGQMVKAGDVLAEIDPRPFQVQLAQAEGQMAKD